MNEDLEIKELWSRVRRVRGMDSYKTIVQIKESDRDVMHDVPVEIANILEDFYENVSSVDSLSLDGRSKYDKLKADCISSSANAFPQLDDDFSIEEFNRALQNTKNSAPAPDGIKYEIFKNMSVKSKSFILEFYNKIWNTGLRPKKWNFSHTLAFPKSKEIFTPDGSRPINLFNSRTKLCDKMINTRLIYTLEKSRSFDIKRNLVLGKIELRLIL